MSMEMTIKVPAVQVPVRAENEAAKDYEQRLMVVCSWLDEMGAVDIDFKMKGSHIAVNFIEFYVLSEEDDWLEDGEDKTRFGAAEGEWIVFMTPRTALVLSPERWAAISV